jgi:RNA polymerase sigma-70 factor (ECF subfamily)
MEGHPSSPQRPSDNTDESPSTSPPQDDTISLINLARAGDNAALERLCSRYLPRLYRWATGRLPAHARSSIETSDLVQDTFLRAIRRLGGFEPRHPGAFPAYLRNALLNRLRDEMRRLARRPSHEALAGSEVGASPTPLEEAIGRDQVEQYEQALLKLKEDERAAIFLRVELELSYKEIAEAMNKSSADAARMAVGRALIRLAEEMRDEV